MTRLVKGILSQRIQDKQVGNRLEVAVAHNSAISAGDCLSVIPQISEGTSGFTRLADRITPKSLTIKGVVSMVDDQADYKDLYVRVLVAAQKNIKVGGQVNAGGVDVSHLLRPAVAGTAEEVAYSGRTENITDPVNKELFRVYYDRTFKLSSSADQTRTAPINRQSFTWSYRFKKLPVNLTYDDGNGDWANNFAPFYAIGYAYADGTAPDVTTLRIVSTTNSVLTYEDA